MQHDNCAQSSVSPTLSFVGRSRPKYLARLKAGSLVRGLFNRALLTAFLCGLPSESETAFPRSLQKNTGTVFMKRGH